VVGAAVVGVAVLPEPLQAPIAIAAAAIRTTIRRGDRPNALLSIASSR